jgi:hypothetical protein
MLSDFQQTPILFFNNFVLKISHTVGHLIFLKYFCRDADVLISEGRLEAQKLLR